MQRRWDWAPHRPTMSAPRCVIARSARARRTLPGRPRSARARRSHRRCCSGQQPWGVLRTARATVHEIGNKDEKKKAAACVLSSASSLPAEQRYATPTSARPHLSLPANPKSAQLGACGLGIQRVTPRALRIGWWVACTRGVGAGFKTKPQVPASGSSGDPRHRWPRAARRHCPSREIRAGAVGCDSGRRRDPGLQFHEGKNLPRTRSSAGKGGPHSARDRTACHPPRESLAPGRSPVGPWPTALGNRGPAAPAGCPRGRVLQHMTGPLHGPVTATQPPQRVAPLSLGGRAACGTGPAGTTACTAGCSTPAYTRPAARAPAAARAFEDPTRPARCPANGQAPPTRRTKKTPSRSRPGRQRGLGARAKSLVHSSTLVAPSPGCAPCQPAALGQRPGDPRPRPGRPKTDARGPGRRERPAKL